MAFACSRKVPTSHWKKPDLILALIDHGCKICGSVPIHYADQNSNDPSSGILTFNYVKNTDCTGNCISANGDVAPPGIGNTDSDAP